MYIIEILLKVALNTIAPTLILYHRIILRKFEDTQGVSRSRESIFENKMNNKKTQKKPHHTVITVTKYNQKNLKSKGSPQDFSI